MFRYWVHLVYIGLTSFLLIPIYLLTIDVIFVYLHFSVSVTAERQKQQVMLTCEICGEELVLEEDMKTHLLLSYMENDMGCPLCSWSGVAYDELHFHINTTHKEKQDHDGGGAEGRGGHRPSSSPTPTTTIVDSHCKQAIGLSRSEGSEEGVANGNRFDTIGGGVSLRTSNSIPESKDRMTVSP